jgi:hypothetical protein
MHRYIDTYIHTYIHAYKHTYIPTYIHTYRHTYTWNLDVLVDMISTTVGVARRISRSFMAIWEAEIVIRKRRGPLQPYRVFHV